MLDLIKYDTKSRPPRFDPPPPAPRKWGIQSIDGVLEGCKDNDINFPIIIAADEYSRPWEILRCFILAGLVYGYGAIFFSFTRPGISFRDDLKEVYDDFNNDRREYPYFEIRNGHEPIWENVVVIDCYSPLTKSDIGKEASKSGVLYADPRNPHEVNKKYEEALKLLEKKTTSGIIRGIRVGYDAISDFLTLTDFQIATQYIRHNMGWESHNKVESLYIFRSGTISSKETEQYLLWFSNGVLKLERTFSNDNTKSYLQADFRGPFRDGPKKFMLDFQFRRII